MNKIYNTNQMVSTSTQRRIFVALKASKALQKNAETISQSLSHLPVRWIGGKNLHLTLIPPWYEKDIDKIISAIKKAVKDIQPFQIEFTEINFGPGSRNFRLIWATGDSTPELMILKSNLETELKPIADTKRFLPHLTLARFQPEEFKNFPIKKLQKQISWKEKFDSIVLMESHVRRNGAQYEVLKEVFFNYSAKRGAK